MAWLATAESRQLERKYSNANKLSSWEQASKPAMCGGKWGCVCPTHACKHSMVRTSIHQPKKTVMRSSPPALLHRSERLGGPDEQCPRLQDAVADRDRDPLGKLTGAFEALAPSAV